MTPETLTPGGELDVRAKRAYDPAEAGTATAS